MDEAETLEMENLDLQHRICTLRNLKVEDIAKIKAEHEREIQEPRKEHEAEVTTTDEQPRVVWTEGFKDGEAVLLRI